MKRKAFRLIGGLSLTLLPLYAQAEDLKSIDILFKLVFSSIGVIIGFLAVLIGIPYLLITYWSRFSLPYKIVVLLAIASFFILAIAYPNLIPSFFDLTFPD
ncbi:hypothetical protein [Hymenobacter sp. HDW8]|uniref:hypothetical protein n=1 Tax=Hymenobacter sp. HDW8 TaxID=2714932 RepID=UPI00140A27B2|nr:hypothetical protein [Hymenobacter sp. HDW8]QIL78445.1 hypothetical protein G7064_21735 [Hymenobacter sp. HDW8]